jgi:hypothetical protein
MTRSASQIIDGYVSALRAELEDAGAPDTDDVVAEIRSLLTEAAGDDPEAAAAETARMGEPAELARGILVERGIDASSGMSPRVWWRLGIAAAVDLAIGLAVPLGAAAPLAFVVLASEFHLVTIAVAALLGLATLAWPYYVWRPWRRGGRSLSPGMTLAGVAVVRAPGFWRVVRIGEVDGLAPAPRRVAIALGATLLAALLLAGSLLVGLDAIGTWAVSSALHAGAVERSQGRIILSPRIAGQEVALFYEGVATVPAGPGLRFLAAPSATADVYALKKRVDKLGIRNVNVKSVSEVAPGIFRVGVVETRAAGKGIPSLGSSTITLGRRYWADVSGSASDWVVVDIGVGEASGAK